MDRGIITCIYNFKNIATFDNHIKLSIFVLLLSINERT